MADRALARLAPPLFEYARCSIRTVVAILQRGHAPSEQDIKLARERGVRTEAILEEHDAANVRIAGERVQKLRTQLSVRMRLLGICGRP